MPKKSLGRWVQRIRIGAMTGSVRGKTKRRARANGIRFLKRYLKK